MKNKIKLIAGVLSVVVVFSPNFALATEKQEIWDFNEVKTIQKGETIDFSKYYFIHKDEKNVKANIDKISLIKKDITGYDAGSLNNRTEIKDLNNLEEGEHLILLSEDRYYIGDSVVTDKEEYMKIINRDYSPLPCTSAYSPIEADKYFKEGFTFQNNTPCRYSSKTDGSEVLIGHSTNGVLRKIKVVAPSKNTQTQDNSSTLETEKTDNSTVRESSKSLQFTAPNTGFESGIPALALSMLSLLGLATFFIRKK